jgi:hypothetical protein
VFLVHGDTTVVIEYEFRGLDQTPAADYKFELRPLIAFNRPNSAYLSDVLSRSAGSACSC